MVGYWHDTINHLPKRQSRGKKKAYKCSLTVCPDQCRHNATSDNGPFFQGNNHVLFISTWGGLSSIAIYFKLWRVLTGISMVASLWRLGPAAATQTGPFPQKLHVASSMKRRGGLLCNPRKRRSSRSVWGQPWFPSSANPLAFGRALEFFHFF